MEALASNAGEARVTLGSHQKTVGASQVHITPRHILDPLGVFDLDPCGNDPRPWDCARVTLTEKDDGLAQPWFGRVWLNPPFNRYVVGLWLAKMREHGHGTALVHARTETAWFREVWSGATALLFLQNRLIFHKPDGSLCTTKKGEVANSGAPVVLAAYGMDDADVLAYCGIAGHFVPLRIPRGVLIEALEPTWREAVAQVLRRYHGPVPVQDLYRALSEHPKARRNPNYRAKIRQTLQRGAGRRVARDRWVMA